MQWRMQYTDEIYPVRFATTAHDANGPLRASWNPIWNIGDLNNKYFF